ncbi:substrate-binding domain-containing protein [Paenibacillaceae bacterium WGS1546]|uniref:substrate-binding domain-containing protein n=1 Tax=Cohnella sp. WGS1546 TaxID=3366810 RepID=UPI00372D54DF
MARRSDTKRLLTFVLAVLAVTLAGSYGLAALRGDEADKPLNITVVIKSVSKEMEFWQVLTEGVHAAAKEFGVNARVVGPQRETDIDVQIDMLREVVQEKPDVILLAAADYNRLAPLAEEIDKAGIPLITIDSGVNSEVPRGFIATDNVEAGKKAARKLAELLEGPSQIAVISYVKETATQIERERGVREVLEADGRFEIVGTYYSNGDENIAYETTKELLRKYPDLKGVVGLNEPSSVGAGRAIKDMGRGGEVLLVGFDSSVDEVRLLEEGVIQATVVQRPFNMGYLGIKTAVDLTAGRKVPASTDTGSIVITKANMYEEENQQLVFPFN